MLYLQQLRELENFFELRILPKIDWMRTLFLLVIVLLCGCRKQHTIDNLFHSPENLGKVSKKLKEASGLVASIKNPGMLWSLNDSGNGAEVFLIDAHGAIQLTCALKVDNRDWEDISIGAGQDPEKSYVYIGDIGDNNANDDLKYIYRFEEPQLDGAKAKEIVHLDTLVLKYPDGNRDAETLMIDPITHDLFIVSKREDSVHIYQAHFPFAKGTIVMDKAATIPFSLAVAGSISANGNEVLLKNYSKILYWKRNKGETIPQLLVRDPIQLGYEPEHQGEAIAWARDSSGFYTLSESSAIYKAQLKFFRRK